MFKEKKNVILEVKADAFALRIIKMHPFLCDKQKEYIMSKQILRCGTSIGASIAEAEAAISQADFSSNISIAYKESLETKYWLRLLNQSDYMNHQSFASMHADADELSRMLFTILKSTNRIKN